MCVWVHVCVWVRVCVCLCVCILHVCVHVCVCVHACMRACVCVHVCVTLFVKTNFRHDFAVKIECKQKKLTYQFPKWPVLSWLKWLGNLLKTKCEPGKYTNTPCSIVVSLWSISMITMHQACVAFYRQIHKYTMLHSGLYDQPAWLTCIRHVLLSTGKYTNTSCSIVVSIIVYDQSAWLTCIRLMLLSTSN